MLNIAYFTIIPQCMVQKSSVGEMGIISNLRVGETGVGEMGVGKMGVGETGVGEMGIPQFFFPHNALDRTKLTQRKPYDIRKYPVPEGVCVCGGGGGGGGGALKHSWVRMCVRKTEWHALFSGRIELLISLN